MNKDQDGQKQLKKKKKSLIHEVTKKTPEIKPVPVPEVRIELEEHKYRFLIIFKH